MEKEYLEALECLEEVIDNLDDYADFEIKQEANEYFDIIEEALQRLESIDNANPSEALKGLKHIKKYYIPEPCSAKTYDCLETIKQALLKAQEPKQYLKWEDLEFKAENSKQNMTVLLNGTKYTLVVGCNVHFDKLAILRNSGINYYFLEADKQFFNDLHLERAEE